MLRSPDNKSSSLSNLASLDKDANTRRKRKNPDDLQSFRDEIKTMLQDWKREHDQNFFELKQDFGVIKKQNEEILKTNSNLEKLIEMNTTNYNNLKKEFDTLKAENILNMQKIVTLENQLDNFERSQRINMIEIQGIPIDVKETSSDLTVKLHSLLNIDCDKSDLKKTFFNRKGKKSSLLVEFTEFEKKKKFINTFKLLKKDKNRVPFAKDICNTEKNTQLYVSDFLTPKNKRLFFLARNLQKNNMYKFCWISNGRVMLRERENCPAINIQNEEQVLKLGEKIA